MNGYIKGEYAFFVIEDNGIGVPDHDLDFLFQRFFSVDKSRQSKAGGMGLGLAIRFSIPIDRGSFSWKKQNKRLVHLLYLACFVFTFN